MKYPEKESSTLEFKRVLPRNDQIVKTVIGFCNQSGGQLIIGVADDRSIVGVPDDSIETTIESVEQAIYDACSPSIIPRISTRIMGQKRLIVIEVSEGMSKPFFKRSEGLKKGTYIRLGKFTARATPEIIEELEWQSRGIDFECLPVYKATKDDLNLTSFEEFMSSRINNGKVKLTNQVLKAYDLITFEHSKVYPSTLGILLFGRNPQQYFSEAMIICTHFKGTSGREAIATIDCEGGLFNQFKKAFSFLIERLNRSFEIKTLKREEKLEVPEIALREALLNMVVHRNYHIKAPSKIAIYDDRIEFFSPGQFASPLDTNNLTQGISYLRNPALCKIMREAGYIEKLGSGFIEIFNSYKSQQLVTPSVIEGENYIKCILPRRKKSQSTETGSDIEKMKQLFTAYEELSIADIVTHLSISRSTALRRLNELLKMGFIERIGAKKSVRYRRKG